MTERDLQTDISPLLTPSDEELAQETELKKKGFIPDRWLQIETIELRRIRSGMEDNLKERISKLSEEEMQQRTAKVAEYFEGYMLPPSFENGPYASSGFLNLYELLPRIVDIKEDESVVPDVDPRVPFHSVAFDKRTIIYKWLIDRTQYTLAEGEKLRDAHINDCFTHVSQNQLDKLIWNIARSGLTLK